MTEPLESTPLAGGATLAMRVTLRVAGADGRARLVEYPGLTVSQAIRQAVSRGLQVLAVEEGGASASASAAGQVRARAARFPLLLFTQELLSLLDAGLNLTEALVTLEAKERTGTVRTVLSELLRSLREGSSFSDALAAKPALFPEVYVATVRASERTGDLPRSLARYIEYRLQFETLRKKLVAAAIYPSMLLVVGSFVTLFLLGYVVPRFSVVYESSGRELPWLSGLLLAFGRAIDAHWPVALGALVAAIGGSAWAASRPQGRAWLLAQVLRLPWFARKADAFRIARFYRAVSLLLGAGVALSRAMGMVTGLLGPAQRQSLERSRRAVDEGQALSAALVQEGLADAVAESLIKVGERSGQLAEMLERTARFADDELARWVEAASRLLEPLLMLVIGLVIGTVVVLMYMPIFDLAGSIQ